MISAAVWPVIAQCQLVLHRGEELFGHGRIGAVVDRQRIDVCNLLVESPLAGSDFADALEQFVKVVLAKDLLSLLQALVVEHEAFDNELPQRLGGPDAKLRGLIAVHSVADSDNGVEVVVLHFTRNRPGTLRANYFHFGSSFLPAQLAGIEDVLQVLVDGRNIDAEQFGQRFLRQPDGFILEIDVCFHCPIWSGIEQELIWVAHCVITRSLSVSGRSLQRCWKGRFTTMTPNAMP